MVERKMELKRRHHRKKKIWKLKKKLELAKAPSEKDAIIKKIQQLSPWWTPPAENQA